jgi:hypothetical protein
VSRDRVTSISRRYRPQPGRGRSGASRDHATPATRAASRRFAVAAHAALTGEGVAALRCRMGDFGFASPRTREGQRRPVGRSAGMRAVFHREREVPYEKSPRIQRSCGPLIQREHFSLVIFLLLL